jgi:hypothetical protein
MRIFGHKIEEVLEDGGNYRVKSFTVCALHLMLGNEIMNNELGRVCSIQRKEMHENNLFTKP